MNRGDIFIPFPYNLHNFRNFKFVEILPPPSYNQKINSALFKWQKVRKPLSLILKYICYTGSSYPKSSEFHEQFKFGVTIRPPSLKRKRMTGLAVVFFSNVEEQIKPNTFSVLQCCDTIKRCSSNTSGTVSKRMLVRQYICISTM